MENKLSGGGYSKVVQYLENMIFNTNVIFVVGTP